LFGGAAGLHGIAVALADLARQVIVRHVSLPLSL
jgi:hypothetical protein